MPRVRNESMQKSRSSLKTKTERNDWSRKKTNSPFVGRGGAICFSFSFFRVLRKAAAAEKINSLSRHRAYRSVGAYLQGIRRYNFFVTSYKYRSFRKKVTSYSYSYFQQKSN